MQQFVRSSLQHLTETEQRDTEKWVGEELQRERRRQQFRQPHNFRYCPPPPAPPLPSLQPVLSTTHLQVQDFPSLPTAASFVSHTPSGTGHPPTLPAYSQFRQQHTFRTDPHTHTYTFRTAPPHTHTPSRQPPHPTPTPHPLLPEDSSASRTL